MNFILSKKQFDLLTSLNGINSFISDIVIEDDFIKFQVQDVSDFQDEIYFNIVGDGMDKEGKVNNFGKIVFDVYDELLYQKYNTV